MADSYAPPAEIAALVANVNKAADDFSAVVGGDLHIARRNLQLEARKLLYSLEEPNHEVWARIFQVNVSVAIEIVGNLKLWEHFEGGKTVTMAQVLELTKADEIVITRIFRQLAAANVFEESAGPSWKLTSLGVPYLNPNHRAFNNLMFVDIIPAIMAMPRTLAEHNYKAPTKESGTPYK